MPAQPWESSSEIRCPHCTKTISALMRIGEPVDNVSWFEEDKLIHVLDHEWGPAGNSNGLNKR